MDSQPENTVYSLLKQVGMTLIEDVKDVQDDFLQMVASRRLQQVECYGKGLWISQTQVAWCLLGQMIDGWW